MHSRHSGAQDVEAVKIISYYRHVSHHLTCTPRAKEATDRDSNDNTVATCQSNYTGTMCMDCAETFYATGKRCEKCLDAEIPHAVLLLLVATWQTSSERPTACASKVVLVVAGGVGALFIRNRMGSGAEDIPCRRSTLLQQLKAQAPLLLQMCCLASSAY